MCTDKDNDRGGGGRGTESAALAHEAVTGEKPESQTGRAEAQSWSCQSHAWPHPLQGTDGAKPKCRRM